MCYFSGALLLWMTDERAGTRRGKDCKIGVYPHLADRSEEYKGLFFSPPSFLELKLADKTHATQISIQDFSRESSLGLLQYLTNDTEGCSLCLHSQLLLYLNIMRKSP